ncbi:MAG TPA: coproporphyrinogen-III oxidase family protein [bacterium]
MQHAEMLALASARIRSFATEELRKAGFLPLDGGYFPAIYYPPITKYPEATQEDIFRGFSFAAGGRNSLYFHLPFCPRRCAYCHWVVCVGNSSEEVDRYLDALRREVRIYQGLLGGAVISPTSILVGGGTPSMLSPAQTERFLRGIAEDFDLGNCRQITCETEPTTILGPEGRAKLRAMKAGGVNRISLGVQSFDDGILKGTGRLHTARDARDALQAIRDAGFESVSIDLIYGYPGSTLKNWVETLMTAAALGVDAYQLYRLRIVPHGARPGSITKMYDTSPEIFPPLEEIYLMKELGLLISERNGYRETSRRVFARGPEHNSEYLQDHTDRLANVLGFGISAWNNLQDRFFINTGRGLDDYHAAVDRGRLPVARGKIKTADDVRRWAVCVSLKHAGVDRRRYEAVTGTPLEREFGDRIERLARYGLLEEREGLVTLTEKGRFFADEVVIQFYHPDYIPFPRSAYADGELSPYRR